MLIEMMCTEIQTQYWILMANGIGGVIFGWVSCVCYYKSLGKRIEEKKDDNK